MNWLRSFTDVVIDEEEVRRDETRLEEGVTDPEGDESVGLSLSSIGRSWVLTLRVAAGCHVCFVKETACLGRKKRREK